MAVDLYKMRTSIYYSVYLTPKDKLETQQIKQEKARERRYFLSLVPGASNFTEYSQKRLPKNETQQQHLQLKHTSTTRRMLILISTFRYFSCKWCWIVAESIFCTQRNQLLEAQNIALILSLQFAASTQIALHSYHFRLYTYVCRLQ